MQREYLIYGLIGKPNPTRFYTDADAERRDVLLHLCDTYSADERRCVIVKRGGLVDDGQTTPDEPILPKFEIPIPETNETVLQTALVF